MGFPVPHLGRLHSTNSAERLNDGIKQRTDAVEIFPNEVAIVRLVGAIMLEQTDEWRGQRGRYVTLKEIEPLSDVRAANLPAFAG